jgi:hypothetical protein
VQYGNEMSPRYTRINEVSAAIFSIFHRYPYTYLNVHPMLLARPYLEAEARYCVQTKQFSSRQKPLLEFPPSPLEFALEGRGMAARWLEFELETRSAVLRQLDLAFETVQQVTLPSAMVPVVVVVNRHTCTVRQAIQIQLLHRMVYRFSNTFIHFASHAGLGEVASRVVSVCNAFSSPSDYRAGRLFFDPPLGSCCGSEQMGADDRKFHVGGGNDWWLEVPVVATVICEWEKKLNSERHRF